MIQSFYTLLMSPVPSWNTLILTDYPPIHRDMHSRLFIATGKRFKHRCVWAMLHVLFTPTTSKRKNCPEIGSYSGKAPPYNEIIMWTNGLKKLSVNPEHTKDKFADVINSICNGSLVQYCKYVHLCSPLFLNIVHMFCIVH
jgi:hypothetical protein